MVKCAKLTVELLIQSLDLSFLLNQADGGAIKVRGILVGTIYSNTCRKTIHTQLLIVLTV